MAEEKKVAPKQRAKEQAIKITRRVRIRQAGRRR